MSPKTATVTVLSATKNNNLNLASLLCQTAKALDLATELICLEDVPLPVYSPTAEKVAYRKGPSDLKNKLLNAQGLVVCAPEYNGGVPPIVSNAVAWISRTSDDWRQSFQGKPTVVATHSGGGGIKVCQAMRSQFEHLGALVLPHHIVTNFQKPFRSESAQQVLIQLKALIPLFSQGLL